MKLFPLRKTVAETVAMLLRAYKVTVMNKIQFTGGFVALRMIAYRLKTNLFQGYRRSPGRIKIS